MIFRLTHLSVVVVDAGAIPMASILQSLKSSLQSLSGFFPCLAHPMYPQMHVTKLKNKGIYSNLCFPISKIIFIGQIKVIRVRYLLTYAFGEDQSLQKEECNKINHMNMVRGKNHILKRIKKYNVRSRKNKKKLNSKFL